MLCERVLARCRRSEFMRRNTYFSRSLVEALLSADTRTGERRTESEVLNKRGPWSYHVPVLVG